MLHDLASTAASTAPAVQLLCQAYLLPAHVTSTTFRTAARQPHRERLALRDWQVARIVLKLGLANGVCEGGSLVFSCPQQFETPPGLQIDQHPLLIPEVSVSVPEDLWWQIKCC